MSIQDFFVQTATVKTRTGYDQYGKELQATGTAVNCRVQEVNRTKILPDGSVEPINAIAFVDPVVTINSGDHFSYNGTDYRVMDVNQVVDGRGLLHHNELRLQKWQS
jgi:hypothetical protein